MQEKIPWRRVLLEGAVIVGSILLAFAIDRIYESAQDSKEEQSILLGLRSDFAANQETLEDYPDSYRLSIERITEVLQYIVAGSTSKEPQAIGEALSLLFNNRTFDPRTATLDLIESSGRGRLLSDAALQRLISEWRMHSDDALDQQQGLQRNREAMLWPALVALEVRTGDGMRTLVDMPQVSPSLQQLRGSEIEAALDVYAALVSKTQLDLVEVLEATEDVLERLEVLLASSPSGLGKGRIVDLETLNS